MKKSFCRPIGLSVLFTLAFIFTQTTANANPSAPGHVSGYNTHVNNQNNWGLFGIIGVIALAGLTKRNVVQKN